MVLKRWLKDCPLSEPELRLYLIEKGRQERVGTCLHAPRSESCGKDEYTVRAKDGTIIVTHEHGRMAASAAADALRKAVSAIGGVKSMLKVCERMLEVEELSEVVSEIKDRRDAHAETVRHMESNIADIGKVPMPVLVETRIKV